MSTELENYEKAMKAARTGEEVLQSWRDSSTSLPGGIDIESVADLFQVYADKCPEIIEHYCHLPEQSSRERAVLDDKTRELVLIGIIAALQCEPGVTVHCATARLAGATEEEIMEVFYLLGYEFSKCGVANLGLAVAEGLRQGAEALSNQG